MLKKRIITTAIAVLFISAGLFAQSTNSLVGKWQAKNDPKRQVEFVQLANGSIEGKAINSTDKKMPNGHTMFQGFSYDAKTGTFKGKMRPPDGKTSIDATATMENPDELKIVGKKLIMTKTLAFTRIK
jgi:dipeptide/tripeptide permease